LFFGDAVRNGWRLIVYWLSGYVGDFD